MSLRAKALIAIGLTLAALLVVLYGISAQVILAGFAAVEGTRVREDVQRALNALNNDVANLNALVSLRTSSCAIGMRVEPPTSTTNDPRSHTKKH